MQSPAPMAAAVLSADELLARLQSSKEGLTSDEARRRLDRVGPNEPAGRRRGAVMRELLGFLANPLVIILLIASLVSAVLGDVVNAAIIVLMVVLSVVLNFVQTYRSQRAAERLREAVAPTATVLRDGAWVELPRRESWSRAIVIARGRRPRAGRRPPARGARPARPAGGADRRVAAGREGGRADLAAAASTAGRGPEPRLPRAPRSSAGRRRPWWWPPGGRPRSATSRPGSPTRPPETEFERGIRRFGLLIMRTVVFPRAVRVRGQRRPAPRRRSSRSSSRWRWRSG